jgi:hypothetical protein
MPVGYAIDRARRFVHIRGEGVVTDSELLEFRDRMRSDTDFVPGLSQLFDFSAATGLELSYEVVRGLAEAGPKHVGDVRRALVAASDEAFGLGRVFEISRSAMGCEVGVFKCVREATRWLGLAPEHAGA